MIEEYSVVRNYTSEENDNGRPCSKSSGAGVDRLPPYFKGKTYETSTHNQLLIKVKRYDDRGGKYLYTSRSRRNVCTNAIKKGNKRITRERWRQ